MKPIRIGVFGLQRGASYFDNILANNGEIVAVCDKRQIFVDKALEKLGDTATGYNDFDEFIEHDMDAVFLANYFHEHAPFAIKALEKGIHVLSECTANCTMAEGVALVKAAQKSSAFYMLAENYPFMLFNQEMRRLYKGGTLGRVMFGEGEYNHPGDMYNADAPASLRDDIHHWRSMLPATYYITHSLAPLCYATGSKPVRVTAMPIFMPPPPDAYRPAFSGDKTAIILTQNDDNSVFRVTGCASFAGCDNSYRICGDKGMVEKVRHSGGKIMLRYNEWDMPEGVTEWAQYYMPELQDKDAELIRKAGHGGGFVLGAAFLLVLDRLLPHLHIGSDQPEGMKSSFKRTTMLVLAVTLHNIPEGLAVGLAFGLAGAENSAITLSGALALSLGMALQNFPEGAAISLPLKKEGLSNTRSFVLGALSGIVEPIAGVTGVLIAGSLVGIMPWFLAFAAGAMVYVVVEELIPEAHLGEHSHTGTISVMLGFLVMMILDVALG